MKDFEKIEQYLADELPERERIAFEEEMASDAALREEVELHKGVERAIFDVQLLDFFEKSQHINATWEAPKPKKKGLSVAFKASVAIAATFALLLAAYLFFQTPTNPETLAAAHFEPYNMVLNYRSDNTDQQLSDAISSYSAENFEEAAALFSDLSSTFPENTAYPFYEAQSLLAAKVNIEKAIEILAEIERTDRHVFQQQARWYLALAYSKKGDEKRAAEILKTIKQGEYQFEKAQLLL